MADEASANADTTAKTEPPDSGRLISLLDIIGGVAWEYDWSTRAFTYVSDGAEALLGFGREAWLRPGFWTDRLHPEDAVWAPEFCRRSTEHRQDHDLEYRMIHADGSTVWVRDVVSVAPEAGSPRNTGLLLNITAQKTALDRVMANERRFRDIVANVGLLAIELDAAGTLVFANEPARRVLGEAAVGRGLGDLAYEPSRTAAREAFDRSMRTGEGVGPLQVQIDAPDGSTRTVRWITANLAGPHGEFAGAVGIGEDVTEHAAYERLVQRKAEEFDAIFALTNDLYFRLDAEGRVIGYAAADPDSLYLPPEQFLGEELAGLMPPDVSEIVKECTARAHETGAAATCRYTLPVAEETPRTWEARCIPLQGGETAVITQDVTERVRRDAALAESEERYRTLVELSPYAIYVVGLDDVVLFCNEAAATLLEAGSAEELTGTRITQLLPTEFVDDAREDELRVTLETARLQPGEPSPVSAVMRCTTLTLRGNVANIERTIAGIRFKDTPALLIIARDISEELAREREARSSYQLLDRLMEALDCGVIAVDGPTGLITRANRPAERLFGYPHGAMVGLSTEKLHPSPEIAERFTRRVVETVAADGLFTAEVILARADGTPFEAEVASRGLPGAPGDRVSTIRDISARKAAEVRAKETESKFRNAIQEAPFGVHFYRLAGEDLFLTGANPAADDLLGYANAPLVGKIIEEAFPGVAATPIPEAFRKVARSGELWRYDGFALARDGGEVRLDVCAFRIEPGAVAATFRDATERAAATDDLAKHAEKLSTLVARIAAIRDEERGQLARALDDDLGAVVSRALSHLSAVGPVADRTAADDLDVARELLADALHETRVMTAQLAVGATVGAGLPVALARLCEETERAHAMPCSLDVSAETAELSDEARSTLFGAARELVRNAVRHSKASATTVALDTDESAVTLTVTDDGVGFDPRTGPQRPGSFGLFAVRDQGERLGGTLDIDSAPGAGTRAQVRVPRQQN